MALTKDTLLSNQTVTPTTENTQELATTAEMTPEAMLEQTSEAEVGATTETTAVPTIERTQAPAPTAEMTPEVTLEQTDEATLGAATGPAVVVTVEATLEVNALQLALPLALAASGNDPAISLGVTCLPDLSAQFVIFNDGGDMLSPGQYTIIDNGTTTTNAFQLHAGQQSSSLAASDNSRINITYSTSQLSSVFLTASGNCTPPTQTPSYTPTSMPTSTPSGNATNTPTPSDTQVPTSTPTPSRTPTLSGTATNTPTPSDTQAPTSTPTPSRTPTLSGTATNTPTPSDSATPSDTPTVTHTPTSTFTPTLESSDTLLSLRVRCLVDLTALFTIVNEGGDMISPGAYTVFASTASPPIAVTLKQGESVSFGAAGNARGDLTYKTRRLPSVFLTAQGRCLAVLASTPSPAPTFTPTNTRTPSSSFTNTPAPASTFTPLPSATATTVPEAPNSPTLPPTVPTSVSICGQPSTSTGSGFPTINLAGCTPDTSVVQRPAWTLITVGGAVCPDWLVYHTNMTGNWELFRLGNLSDGVQADPNLSRGVGPRIFSIMPTSSPDRKWIAFTSNRDGNWEIYLSAVEKDAIRRVTYNTTAIDLNPTWSPTGNQIIYESTRDGNWELYLFDVNTGKDTRLTTNPGNDVNAAWSKDGSKIAFESDRDGVWQIYELDLKTSVTRRLSDGTGDDHEPQFSNDGQTIVFRSYRAGDMSVLYTMDADGKHLKRISDPAGNALNAAISPDDKLIAYQSTLSGENNIYVYEIVSGLTRLVTANATENYAPTWWCDSTVVVFTSDVTGDANLFDTSALPMNARPISVEKEAHQLTTDPAFDQYPENAPPKEAASRQGNFPPPVKSN